MNDKENSKTVLAKVLTVMPYRDNKVDDGSMVRFVTANNNLPRQIYQYYTKPINGRDNGSSIKTVCHFLDLPFTANNGFNYRKLVGRYCNIHIVIKNIRGNQRPVIEGFSFAEEQLFRGFDND